MPDESVSVATPVAEKSKRGRKPIPEGLKSPTALEFALVYNAASSRQDAVAAFAKQGFHMTYGSLLARVKSYTEGPNKVNLKDMPAGQRGRKIDVDAINKAIEEAAAAATVVAAATGEASA